MTPSPWSQPIEILLVEDNPGDVRLTRELLNESRIRNRLEAVDNGAEALAYLRREGQYADALSSRADADVLQTYDLHANCYVTKPVGLEQFAAVVKSIEDFWLAIVRFPPGPA